eukprot:UN25612
MPIIPTMCQFRNVHVFQTSSHYYYRPIFYVAFQVVEIGYMLIEQTGQNVIIYALAGLNDGFTNDKWWYFLVITLVGNNIGKALAIAVTISLSNSEQAHAVLPGIFYLMMLTTGYVVTKDDLQN